MRAGEPLALGVSNVYPKATFVHAQNPIDITAKHLEKNHNVILVDSVINSGQTVVDFVSHIRNEDKKCEKNLVIVAGIIQSEMVEDKSRLHQLAQSYPFSLVALRVSETKYKGKGSTDTGNRLFNTTSMDN